MSDTTLQITLTPLPDSTTLATLTGEAGQPQESLLNRYAADLSALPSKTLILNLAHLTFISSVGLRTLVAIQRQFKGQLLLQQIPENILSILKRCKLDGQFQII